MTDHTLSSSEASVASHRSPGDRPQSRALKGTAVLLFACLLAATACSQPQLEDTPLAGTLSDNPMPTDSIYGTPPDPIPDDPPPPPTSGASPTGRQPRLIWTAARQATWDRMVRENHPRFQHIRNKCAQTRSGSPAYGDVGLWCALEYQMTGDVSAARAAWTVAGPAITEAPPGGNEVREGFIDHAILFDWLYPALTDAERAQAIAGLNTWAEYALAVGTPVYEGGIRVGDSDRTVGYYFGLALTDLATRGMPGHRDWLSATQGGWAGNLPVGGLTATGVNWNTARNAVGQFIQGPAHGGQWIESSDYDQGTMQLLIVGAEAVRTAAGGSDPFPELDPFLRAAAKFNTQVVTGDLNQGIQWGDDEHPRDFVGRFFQRVTTLGLLAGATEGTVESGQAMGLIDALSQRYGSVGWGAAEPWARFYLLYDPYAPRASWQSTPMWFADGMGQMIVRSASGLFTATMANRTEVDHELQYLSDFQLYRNGEWAITHPIGYAGPAVEAEGVNSLLLAGLSAMQTRGSQRVESGSGWWAITGSSSGGFYPSDYYDPPPAFLTNWTRTVVYLQRNGVDHVITVDRLQMADPKSLARFDRYRPEDAAKINAAPGLVQWLIHTPSPAQGSGNRWSWNTPGGQPVVVTAVGATPNAQVLSEATLWNGTWNFQSSELGYQLRLVPAFTGGSTVLRNVVTVGDGNPTITGNGDTITINGVNVTVTATGVQVSG